VSEASYRRRVAADVARWRDNGWITPEGAAAILASIPVPQPRSWLAGIIAVLGSLLLGLGVMALVAANWEAIPRIVRLALLLATLGAGHGIAAMFRRRGRPLASEAAMTLAGLVFAAAIALVGQTYHLAGEFTDAVLLFVGGCLGAGFLAGSAAMTLLALCGALVWTVLVTDALQAPHLAGLAPILAGLAIATFLDSWLARLAGILALWAWIGLALFMMVANGGWPASGALAVGIAVALALWALGVVLAAERRGAAPANLANLGGDLLRPSLIAALLLLFALQAVPLFEAPDARLSWLPMSFATGGLAVGLAAYARFRRILAEEDLAALAGLIAGSIAFAALAAEDSFWVRLAGGALVLGASVWMVALARTDKYGAGFRIGLVAFAFEALYLYTITLGTVLDTAFALLVGGILFIALAYALLRFGRRLGPPAEAAS
jgi:uncharacterized membrane protein